MAKSKRTSAIINQKGGVGKSTAVSSLASILTEKGRKVLTINLDPQRNVDMAAGAAIGRADTGTLNMLHVMNREVSLSDIIISTPIGDLARASSQLYSWSGHATEKNPAITQNLAELSDTSEMLFSLAEKGFSNNSSDDLYILRDEIAKLEKKYDHILIDTNPSLTELTLNALYAADYVVVPAFPEESSLTAIRDLWDTIQGISFFDATKRLEVAGILITKCKKNTVLYRDFVDNYQKMAIKMGSILFNSAISDTVAVGEYMSAQTDLIRYLKQTNPKSKVLGEYYDFAEEFERRIKTLEAKRRG
jgi:ATPases involved in chromosome partitioning